MNLILLFEEDFIDDLRITARLKGRRFEHVRSVLKPCVGDKLEAGLLYSRIGKATVMALDEESVTLDVLWRTAPPEPLPLTLILALPRPPMLRRCLQTATAMGVKKIYILNFSRVEKSFWNSSALREEDIQEQIILGLEQAKDTIPPQVVLKQRFKPFVEDELPAISEGSLRLVAHPETGEPCPSGIGGPATLVIGPEGGLVPFEVEALKAVGFQPIHAGPRILRVETALPVLAARLFPTPVR